MTQNTRNLPALTLIGLVAAGFLFGSGYTYYWQKTGEPATAAVTRCETQRRAHVCRGTWIWILQ